MNICRLISASFSMLLWHAGCDRHTPERAYESPASSATSTQASSAEAVVASVPGSVEDTGTTVAFSKRLRLHVIGKELRVTDAAGAILARNARIIRLRDEAGDCPSEGFGRIVVKSDMFTIEQQACSGWRFIDEYITFKFAPATSRFMLYRAAYTFTDRRNPDKDIPQRTLTTKHFGKPDFEAVDAAALYRRAVPPS